jgi:Holliday junction resolvase RusA-like endonuclease
MPHQGKKDSARANDISNLWKALEDALLPIDDSHVYDVQISKYWSDTGYVTIEIPSVL